MKLFISSFSTSKLGNEPSENEDSFFPNECKFEGESFTIALADGATEGVFSSIWAKILVKLYASNSELIKTPQIYLQSAKENFHEWKLEYIKSRETDDKPLLWFEEVGLSRGVYSTIVGVTFYDIDSEIGRWEASAIGDSCLIHLRDDEILRKFPIDHSNEFNNQPWLLSTTDNSGDDVLSYIKTIDSDWASGDTFILLSDALAHWCYSEIENDKNPFVEIKHFLDNGNFEDFLCHARKTKIIKNDDVTVLFIELV